MRCKASETLIGTVCMPLCASVHPHLNYLALLSFYGLAVYLNVVVCKHLFCDALWLTIFCTPTLFDCANDMDYVSEIKYYYSIINSN